MEGSSIDFTEDRIFRFDDEIAMLPEFLQKIDYSGLRKRISYQINEFVAVCLFSGLPDTGMV